LWSWPKKEEGNKKIWPLSTKLRPSPNEVLWWYHFAFLSQLFPLKY
jgi:hypothetical protein